MKHIITQNQVYVETEIHSVISTPVCHSSMGGPSSLEISRQLMFHPQGLPAVFFFKVMGGEYASIYRESLEDCF